MDEYKRRALGRHGRGRRASGGAGRDSRGPRSWHRGGSPVAGDVMTWARSSGYQANGPVHSGRWRPLKSVLHTYALLHPLSVMAFYLVRIPPWRQGWVWTYPLLVITTASGTQQTRDKHLCATPSDNTVLLGTSHPLPGDTFEWPPGRTRQVFPCSILPALPSLLFCVKPSPPSNHPTSCFLDSGCKFLPSCLCPGPCSAPHTKHSLSLKTPLRFHPTGPFSPRCVLRAYKCSAYSTCASPLSRKPLYTPLMDKSSSTVPSIRSVPF